MFGQQINFSATGRKFYQPDKRRILQNSCMLCPVCFVTWLKSFF